MADTERKIAVYVAGAYTPVGRLQNPACEIFDNMGRGLRLARRLLKAGFVPFAPWLDFLFGVLGEQPLPVEVAYSYSIEWLRRSDVMIVQPVGALQSTGVKKELQIAKAIPIPVFFEPNENEAVRKLLHWAAEQMTSRQCRNGRCVDCG